jgi:hypothetical protein
MILFENKPDSVCEKFLSGTLETVLDDCRVAVQEGNEDVPYLSDDCIRMFGGPRTLLAILTKVKAIYDAPEMFEVSDYYNFLLDEIVRTSVELYNDGYSLLPQTPLVHPSGRVIEKIDPDMLICFLFSDQDFNLDPAMALGLRDNPEAAEQMGFTPEAIGATLRRPPDSPDLWIRRCERVSETYALEEPDWFDEVAVQEEPEVEQDGAPGEELPF